MVLVVCASCRRHHVVSEPQCPFCARATRRLGVAFCALVLTVGCAGGNRNNRAVYGGPPPDWPDRVSFEIAVAGNHPVLSLFAAHADAAGCTVENFEEVGVVARCPGANIGVEHRKNEIKVSCSTQTVAQCRALWDRIGETKLTKPVDGLPLDAPIAPSPIETTNDGDAGVDAAPDGAADALQ